MVYMAGMDMDMGMGTDMGMDMGSRNMDMVDNLVQTHFQGPLLRSRLRMVLRNCQSLGLHMVLHTGGRAPYRKILP